MQCIYLFTPQEAEIVDNSRQSCSVVNSLGSFFMALHKRFSCFGFSLSLLMITLKSPNLFVSPGPTNITTMTRQHKQFPLTFVCSLAPTLSMKSLPTEAYQCKKGVFQNHLPVSGVNFSNNISIAQVSVNIKNIEHDKFF